MTDWMWCYDNPKEAAEKIDNLLSRIQELEELRRNAALNHDTICNAIHEMYKQYECTKSI